MRQSAEDVHTMAREDTTVREGIDTARDEAALGLSEARHAVVALAAGGVCGLLALLSAHSTLVRGLERVWAPEKVTGALTVVYASGASVLVHYGSKRMRVARAASHKALHSSVDVVRHVVDELKDA
ncbi:phage holin family protein [Streptomyces sp. NPDC057116]|uniref:phage holin family protein n=1 Tax=Streptomyces sp. NPDC057116 TaxID=3346023 RepID=UPI003634613C